MNEIIPLKPLHVWGRGRTEKDWKCPRSRYWAYDHKNQGLVSQEMGIELFLGAALHDGLAAIAHREVALREGRQPAADIDLIATTAQQQVQAALLDLDPTDIESAAEQSTLIEGLLRGFNRHTWPLLLQQYPHILAIEEWMQFEHDGMVFVCRPDLVMADADNNLAYLEHKSTSNKRESWINSWQTAVQLHATSCAIEATLGQPVQQVQVIGHYKGYESYGKQSSPLCYAYKKAANPPFTKEEIAYDYKAGFRRTPTWELQGGVKVWVNAMPINILADNYPMTPPIFPDRDLIDAFIRQRTIREFEIREAVKVTEDDEMPPALRRQFLDAFFPQKFSECNPAYGAKSRPCDFKRLCFGSADDPVGRGGYEWREPSSPAEIAEKGVE